MPIEYRFDDLDLREEPRRGDNQPGDMQTTSTDPQCTGTCYTQAVYTGCTTG